MELLEAFASIVLEACSGVLLGSAAMLAVWLLSRLTGAVQTLPASQQPESPFAPAPHRLRRHRLLVGMFLLAMAWLEELIFRVWLLRALQPLLAPPWPLLLMSAAFAVMHVPNLLIKTPNDRRRSDVAPASLIGVLGLFNTGLCGFGLGAVYLATGSITVVTGAHFAWNAWQWQGLGYPLYGFEELRSMACAPRRTEPKPDAPPWLSGGAYGAEASLFTGLIWLAIGLLALP